MSPAKQAEARLLRAARLLATAEQRAAFLRDCCGDDAQLRQRLEAKLRAEEQTGETEDADAVVSSYSASSPAGGLAAAPLKPGDRVGHYVVVRRQGAGGMGEVYLAQDTRLGRLVALKFLPEEAAGDAARRQRFFSEARAAAALSHPNICTVYDVAQSEDALPYIAMEWLEGPTLRERMAGAPMPLDELLQVGLQIAAALEAAHARGIIHRDLKPANISLLSGGPVKVLDFGLAKWQQLVSPEDPGTTSAQVVTGQIAEPGATTTSQTAAGQIVGSPGYMSPEQATGQPVDQRTDLFSLGVILYEMATGRPPFAARTRAEILKRTVEYEPEPLARFNVEVPPELERIVTKCLQKDPSQRYPSARELHADLATLWSRLAAPKGVVSGQVVTLLCLEIPEAASLRQSGRLHDAAELLRQQRAKVQKLLKEPEQQVEAFGEALLVQFGRASEAVQATLRVVSENGVACRQGLHLAELLEPQQTDPLSRYGVHLETVVRLAQLAEPGHVLMSRGVFDNARVVLRQVDVVGLGALSWVSHGQYAFSGLEEPLEVCEVSLAGRAVPSAPPTTKTARRLSTGEGDTVLGWRPGVG
ncbi:MAG TPA: serine/threonine-protein kinase, partial [Verrucomicrobiae bacterium]